MRRSVLTAVVLSCLLTGCTTYRTPGGHTNYGSPGFCSKARGGEPSACALLLGAAVIGAGVLIAK